jgi:hypothetical protein
MQITSWPIIIYDPPPPPHPSDLRILLKHLPIPRTHTDTHTLAYLSPYIDLLVLCTASPLGLLCTRQYSLLQLYCTSVPKPKKKC